MTNTWTRNADGTYSLAGWTIRKIRMSGSGQSKPFRHVSRKAYDLWEVTAPSGGSGPSAGSLANAKLNVERQIAIRGSR